METLTKAAERVLDARRADMCTVDEWVALARAVAACTGRKTVDLLTRRDFELITEYTMPWDPAVDGAMPEGED